MSDDFTIARPQLEAVKINKANAAAIKAVWEGNASEQQQQRAMMFIFNDISGMANEPFMPNDRDTSFYLGKQNVGRVLMYLKNANIGDFKDE